MVQKYRRLIIEQKNNNTIDDNIIELKERIVYIESLITDWENTNDLDKRTSSMAEYFTFDHGVKHAISSNIDIAEFSRLLNDYPDVDVGILLSWIKL